MNSDPIVWLNPCIFNADHKNYTSIEDAKRAFNEEKQQIINCYERQLQRLLTQFSIALKQIEYLEEFRKEQNKHNYNKMNNKMNNNNTYTIENKIGYDFTIDKLNRKIHLMNEEMINIKNLYLSKINIISCNLENKLMYLETQLRSELRKNRILTKTHTRENILKAKKKIQQKKQKQITAEEFKLQVEQMQINKDIVINRLAQEYHKIVNKEEQNKEKINELCNKLKQIHQNNNRNNYISDSDSKEKEYKLLLSQYKEVRENNAKLTLTFFTLQCEYDKLKRDYDIKSAMLMNYVMNYGNYQISLINTNSNNNSLCSSDNDDDNDCDSNNNS